MLRCLTIVSGCEASDSSFGQYADSPSSLINELAAPFAMSLPAVSRHLKVLEKAGLVSKGRSAQWRPCRLEVEQLRLADEWMAPYREFFESRFDRLEEHLKTMDAESQSKKKSTDDSPQRGRK